MRTLFFQNNVHNIEPIDIPNDEPRAVNMAVRKGLKWSDLEVGEIVEVRETDAETPPAGQEVTAKIYDIKVMVFKDFMNYDRMLDLQHDPACRDFNGLHATMKQIYDGFIVHELVTVIYYEINQETLR